MNYNCLDEEGVLEGVKKFGPAPGAKKLIEWEYQHAKEAIESGYYVTYYCEKKKMECGRIGSNSKCFCNHLYSVHNQKGFGRKIDIKCQECPCKSFKFVPTRPEECGMWWLPRRKDFKVFLWRAPCKCKHGHDDHSENYPLRCRKCPCKDFNSYFACISCDCSWEDHVVLFETEMERKADNKAIREAYLPLSKNLEIQHEAFKYIKK